MEQPGPDIRGYADAGVLHFEAHELPGLVLIDRFSPQHDAVALAELRRIAGEVEQRLLAAYRENSAAAPETTIWGGRAACLWSKDFSRSRKATLQVPLPGCIRRATSPTALAAAMPSAT